MSFTFNNEVTAKIRKEVDEVKKNLVIEGGVIKEKEKGASYINTLPEGIDEKTVEKVRHADAQFLKATEVAMAEMAMSEFKKEKELDKVTGSVDALNGAKVQSSIFREKTYTNNFAKEGEDKTITKHLVVSTKAEFVSTRGIGSIRDAMSKEAKSHIK